MAAYFRRTYSTSVLFVNMDATTRTRLWRKAFAGV